MPLLADRLEIQNSIPYPQTPRILEGLSLPGSGGSKTQTASNYGHHLSGHTTCQAINCGFLRLSSNLILNTLVYKKKKQQYMFSKNTLKCSHDNINIVKYLWSSYRTQCTKDALQSYENIVCMFLPTHNSKVITKTSDTDQLHTLGKLLHLSVPTFISKVNGWKIMQPLLAIIKLKLHDIMKLSFFFFNFPVILGNIQPGVSAKLFLVLFILCSFYSFFLSFVQ